MNDYLRDLYSDKCIALMYTDNSIVILSNEVNNDIRILKVNKILTSCSKETALAILSDYLKYGHKLIYFTKIFDHIELDLDINQIKFSPLFEDFRDLKQKNNHGNKRTNNDYYEDIHVTHLFENYKKNNATMIYTCLVNAKPNESIELNITLEKPK